MTERQIEASAMTQLLERVRTALASEPRLDLHRFPIELSDDEGLLTLEGEVPDIAAKKLALERAAALPGVSGIDRLRVQPAQRMGDGEIRDLVLDALLQESAFADFALHERFGERIEAVGEPAEARGSIELEVEDGVVTLNGRVPGLDDKRLAGVLAAWVPGSRDVINGIAVEPPEDDSDEAILEAVRLVLEKDPFVDASQIRARTAQTAVIIGDRAFWGQKVVLETRGRILEFLFDEVGMEKVWGTPFDRNFPSVFNYKAQGFRLEGILRSHRVAADGRRVDQYIFGLLRHEWQARSERVAT